MKAKRILSFLLVFVLCVAMFPAAKISAISTSSVEANLTSWRSNLDGKYWNYYDRSVYDSRRSYVQSQLISIATSGILSNPNATDAQVGVTSTACAGSTFATGCRSNYFAGAWQCRSFARFIDYALFGSTWAISSSGWTQFSSSALNSLKLQPGDHIVSSGHEAIIWKVSNGNISCVECWGGSGCKISYSPGFNWSQYTTESGLLSYLIADGGSVWRYSECFDTTAPVYPSKPVINDLNSSYEVNEPITIRWSTAENATHYALYLYKALGNNIYVVMDCKETTNTQMQISVSEPNTDNFYCVQVRAYNSNSKLDTPVDGSNYPFTDSEKVFFRVEQNLIVTKTVHCGHEITLWPNASVYRSPTDESVPYTYGDKYQTIDDVLGYVELSDGSTKYFYDGGYDNGVAVTYYVPMESVNASTQYHTFVNPAKEHPHYCQCECGDTQKIKDSTCYICYPARIEYKSDLDSFFGDGDAAKQLPKAQEGGPVIDVTSDIPNGYGTFIGWKYQKQDGTNHLRRAGDSISLSPGETTVLTAIWDTPTFIDNVFVKPEVQSSIPVAGSERYFEFTIRGFNSNYKISCTLPDGNERKMAAYLYESENGKMTKIVDFGGEGTSGAYLVDYLEAGKTYTFRTLFSDEKAGDFTFKIEQTGLIWYYKDASRSDVVGSAADENGIATIVNTTLYQRDGYRFLGWSKDPYATSAEYHAGDRVSVGKDGIWELYAVWEKISGHTHSLTHTAKKSASCTASGNIEYWHCSGCGKYYLDANAANETTAEKTILPALGHNYVNGTCTRCSAKDPNAAEPDPNAAVVSVVPVRGKAGQTVEVTVTLENNPGFSDLSLEIGYDADVIELTKVTPNSAVGCIFTTSQQLTQLPYRLNWVNGTEDNTFTGTLVTLTFQIKDSAELGSYPVTVSYYKGKYGNNIDGEDVNYNQNGSRVPIIYVNGSVTVYSYTPGDLNGDGRINSKDAIYLLRYIAGWELDGLVEDALDVNGDGKINSKDAVHLLRYIAGWDVTLH